MWKGILNIPFIGFRTTVERKRKKSVQILINNIAISGIPPPPLVVESRKTRGSPEFSFTSHIKRFSDLRNKGEVPRNTIDCRLAAA